MRNTGSVLAWTSHALIAALVAGCGGNSGDSGTTQPPVITAQPQGQAVLTGSSGVFAVSASGTGGLTYQWKRNGTVITGATAATYTTPPASYLDKDAQYTVVVANAGGSTTSTSAQLTLTLSANQQAFESLMLAPNPGSYRFRWNLSYLGPQTVGISYAYSDHTGMSVSPLTNGPQTNVQSAPMNITSTLDLTNLVNSAPTRILKNGSILVVPGIQESTRVSYVGSNIKVESLASDNTTAAFTEIRSDYSSIPLTGVVASAPTEFAHWYHSFFSNAAILKPSSTFMAGAAYLKYTDTNLGDRYDAFDCAATTTGANVTPCVIGATLVEALTMGILSDSDGTTYHLADGTMTTVGGVSMWIASSERPQSASFSSIVQYRIYFQLNGNVYTGTFIKDGTRVGGSYWVSTSTGVEQILYLPYQIRLNKNAHDSIVSAMAI